MNYPPDFLEKEARRIIDLLKKDFLLKDGSLCLEKVGEKKRPYHIFSDMGDFFPFLLYFGELEFVGKQIEIFKNMLQDGLWVSEHPTWGIKGLVKSYEYSDLLYGLMSFYEFNRSEENLHLLLENVDRATDVFCFSKQPSSFFLKSFGVHIPILDSRDGMFTELLVDLFDLTGEGKYLEIADNLFRELTAGGFYKKYHLLPNFCGRGIVGSAISLVKKDFFIKAEIMKYNTNCLHAFLALFKKTGDEKIRKQIENIIESVKRYATFGGGIAQFFTPGQAPKEAYLGSSFSIIDFLCDYYHCFKRREDLELAERIADFWIEKQGKSGLFPLYSGKRESFLDFETDMSVALSRLFELTGEDKYRKAVDDCVNGVLKWHGERNYILSVHTDTGKILNEGQRTKFVSLFLKLMILRIEQSKGKRIYSDERLLKLIEDR